MKISLFISALLLTCSAFGQDKTNVVVTKSEVVVVKNTDITPEEEERITEAVKKNEESADSENRTEGVSTIIDTQLNYAPSWTFGSNEDDSTHKGSARILVDIISNKTNKVLYTIPINAKISKIKDNGTNIENRVMFDIKLQKVFNSHFGASLATAGFQDDFGDIRKQLSISSGLDYEILGNLSSSDKAKVITSVYYMRNKDILRTGMNKDINSASLRLEVRDLIIANKVKVNSRFSQNFNLANLDENSTQLNIGATAISSLKILGTNVSITPSYTFKTSKADASLQRENLHNFNLSVTMNLGQLSFGRKKKKR